MMMNNVRSVSFWQNNLLSVVSLLIMKVPQNVCRCDFVLYKLKLIDKSSVVAWLHGFCLDPQSRNESFGMTCRTAEQNDFWFLRWAREYLFCSTVFISYRPLKRWPWSVHLLKEMCTLFCRNMVTCRLTKTSFLFASSSRCSLFWKWWRMSWLHLIDSLHQHTSESTNSPALSQSAASYRHALSAWECRIYMLGTIFNKSINRTINAKELDHFAGLDILPCAACLFSSSLPSKRVHSVHRSQLLGALVP